MNRIHSIFHRIPFRQILSLFCGILVCTALYAEAAQTELSEHIIRLHVIAHSDNAADQTLKLLVRDRVLAGAENTLSGAETPEAAFDALQNSLPQLEALALQVIREQGYHYPVQVRLERCWFPTRQYEGVSLPAGTYQALRVIIGAGEGQNWWCVLFPSLSMPGVSEQAVPTAGLSGQEYALITEQSQPYVFRFKTLEWWDHCKQLLAARP